MNRFRYPITAVVVITSLGGCAPLQQAPLVYSSKVVVGADVSANTTENPGVSINLGVKSIDAAYVPVAVSKPIDENAKKSNEATLDIMPIYARYGRGSTQESPDKLTEDNKRKISAYLEAKQQESAAQDLVSKADAKVKELTSQITTVDNTQTAISAAQKLPATDPAALGAAGQSERDKRVNDINGKYIQLLNDSGFAIGKLMLTASGSYNFDTVNQQLASTKAGLLANQTAASNELNQNKAIKSQKQQQAEQLFADAAKAANLLQTNKTDALSVYGRFDSNGSASTGTSTDATKPNASGGLLVGKVFSTGLASQNLTEAAKIEARSKCITEMLSITRLLKEEDRKLFTDKISAMCSPQLDASQ